MYCINKEVSVTYEEKKSKFIAHLCPMADFKKVIERLKKKHPKARHFVYAYRYLNEYDQIVENSSDDGEPKGTSGKPCLNVLAGNELINTAVIVVRYFGGTKLGTGGLVRAYSDAVNLVLSQSKLHKYEKLETYIVEIEYDQLQKIEYDCNDIGIWMEKSFAQKVTLTLQGSYESFELLYHRLPRELGGDLKVFLSTINTLK